MMTQKLADLIPPGIFLGTSLILPKGDRFLYGVRPPVEERGRTIAELTGIGGKLEPHDPSYTAGVLREAQEETGCEVALIDCPETQAVRGANGFESIVLAGGRRPAAVVVRRYGTPPHQPWDGAGAGEVCVIVFAGALAGQPEPRAELPWLIWLRPEHVLRTARADCLLEHLLEDGAELVLGEGPPPEGSLWVRMTDSQEALAIALGECLPAFYRSIRG